jgi:hypothetical protein
VLLANGITSVTILADGDEVGERTARAAARHLVSAVRIVCAGTDFNDLLTTTGS